MMLEGMCHSENSFITLTFRDDNRPREVNVESFQNFFKRFRNDVAGRYAGGRVRVFYSGEYGDGSWHPHYHAIVFGYPPCERGGTKYRAVRGELRFECCDTCRMVHESWGFGKIDVGTATQKSFQYVARYVNKKMTSRDDVRLNGRHPEFAHQSRSPGIGIPFVREHLLPVLSRYIRFESDIPVTLEHGGKHWPLGRTLRNEIKKGLGFTAKSTSYDDLQDVPGIAEFLSKNPSNQEVVQYLANYQAWKRVNAALRKKEDVQRIRNLKAREGIYKKGSRL